MTKDKENIILLSDTKEVKSIIAELNLYLIKLSK